MATSLKEIDAVLFVEARMKALAGRLLPDEEGDEPRVRAASFGVTCGAEDGWIGFAYDDECPEFPFWSDSGYKTLEEALAAAEWAADQADKDEAEYRAELAEEADGE